MFIEINVSDADKADSNGKTTRICATIDSVEYKWSGLAFTEPGLEVHGKEHDQRGEIDYNRELRMTINRADLIRLFHKAIEVGVLPIAGYSELLSAADAMNNAIELLKTSIPELSNSTNQVRG